MSLSLGAAQSCAIFAEDERHTYMPDGWFEMRKAVVVEFDREGRGE